MTPAERRALAQQITTNPLYAETLDAMERQAIETMIAAMTDEARHDAQLRIQAVRKFRRDLGEALSTREPKDAPA